MQAHFPTFITPKSSNVLFTSLTLLGVIAVHLLIVVLVFHYVSLHQSNRMLKPNFQLVEIVATCLLYTSPSPRDQRGSRMPSSA